jgi:hypothetical protein
MYTYRLGPSIDFGRNGQETSSERSKLSRFQDRGSCPISIRQIRRTLPYSPEEGCSFLERSLSLSRPWNASGTYNSPEVVTHDFALWKNEEKI